MLYEVITRIIAERERLRAQLSESTFVERIFPSDGNSPRELSVLSELARQQLLDHPLQRRDVHLHG